MKVWFPCLFYLLGCVVVSAQAPLVPESPAPSGIKKAPTAQATGKKKVKPADQVKKPDSSSAAESTNPVKEEPKQPAIPQRGDEAVRLQIFLDQKHFGPGFIDGKPGTFTKLAIANYNKSLGKKPDDLRIVEESVQGVTQPYATAIVPKVAKKYVDPSLPTKKSLQAQRKSMPYRSIAEFMAERYHTSEDLLIELNGASVVRNAKVRSALKVPNIEPFKIEDLRVGRSHKKEEHLSARHIVVDTGVKQVYIYQLMVPKVLEEKNPGQAAGQTPGQTPDKAMKLNVAKPVLIASFPITPGKTRFIPKGFWNLKNSVELPEWRYDKQLLETGVRGKEYLRIPPGPNNPVGIIWNGLTKSGIGIHGTNNPRTIGRARSAGCIRLANWDAARIPRLVRPGAVVVIK